MRIGAAFAAALEADQTASRSRASADVPDLEALIQLNDAAASVPTPSAMEEFEVRGPGAPVTSETPTTLFQVVPYPVTLDPTDYANARSNSNPNGDLLPLYRFRQLVDPIPTVSEDYNTTGGSTEGYYGGVIGSATALPQATFVSSLIYSAQQSFNSNAFSNLDGTVGSWRPVYATPEDWYDTSNSSRFRPLDIDLSGGAGNPNQLVTMGDGEDLKLRIGTQDSPADLDPGTVVRKVSMRYLLVTLVRPWYNASLFSSDGWYLGAQQPGFCSTGKFDSNTGILPILPTGLLVGLTTKIDATWAGDDAARIESANSAGEPAFLGPFRIDEAGTAAPSLQVVAWVSALTPLSPREARPATS